MLRIPRIKREDVEYEVEAIKKVGKHLHIVEVLNHGDLRNTEYYFIDMELCDLNLDEYIHRQTAPNPLESIPSFVKNASPPLKAQQIWNIMRQIASGLEYMHTLNVVHRDLKPANGDSLAINN